MTVEISIDGWERVKEAALFTVGLKAIADKPISSEWKSNILMSRHSPIRELRIKVEFRGIERWVADQIIRHVVGVNSFMRTNRPDRGGIPRDEQKMTMLVDLMQSYNGESFINLMETRLCTCVSKETRDLLAELLKVVKGIEPELAFICVPSCVKLGACKEAPFTECKYWEKFVQFSREISLGHEVNIFSDLSKRYAFYNTYRS